jgi:FKBP-type peptidyl-prolyl cis-trans isomerase
MRQQQVSSASVGSMLLMVVVVLTTLSATVTTTLAFTPCNLKTRMSQSTPTMKSSLFVSSSASTSAATATVSSFDTYQPGVTTDIVWKDTSSSNNNAYTAKQQDVCVVSYVGTIMSTGFVFNKNEEFVFQIGSGQSMPGFDVGCIGMTEQTVRTIRVPPNCAYGMKGTYDGRVPPNADLEFVITMKRLVSYESAPLLAQLAMFGELRLIGLLGCVAVLALPPLFQ